MTFLRSMTIACGLDQKLPRMERFEMGAGQRGPNVGDMRNIKKHEY